MDWTKSDKYKWMWTDRGMGQQTVDSQTYKDNRHAGANILYRQTDQHMGTNRQALTAQQNKKKTYRHAYTHCS